MPGPTDPNDPNFANNPAYVFANGRWQYRGTNYNEAEAQANPLNNTTVSADSVGSATFSPTSMAMAGKTLSDTFGGLLGQNPTIPGNSPGSTLDTTQSNDDRSRMASILAGLQQQAATGGGAWESALANATQRARNSAEAIGQSQQGVSRMAALRNISNAQAGADQRAAGEATVLRNQQEQQAAQQLAGLYGQQGGLEAQQAAGQAGAIQGANEANSEIMSGNRSRAANFLSGAAQGAGTLVKAGLSHGGPVPGKPKVFGDSEVNDTVPAKLSPGEIVIPRSIATGPDAPERAAEFVRQVHARKGQRNFDDGGQVADPSASMAPGISQAASINNGALLDTGAYDTNRNAALQNINQLAAMGAGRGPSVVPQETTNATDANVAAAMQASANARGMGAQAAQGNEVAQAGARGAHAAGDVAAKAAEEQAKGNQAAAHALLAQRQQDLAFAQARQQAAWRNTMMNAGLSAQQQAAMRSILGGVGQAAVAGSSQMGADGGGGGGYAQDSIDAAFDATPVGSSDSQGVVDGAFDSSGAGDYSASDEVYAAHGGEMVDPRAAAFVEALKRRRV